MSLKELIAKQERIGGFIANFVVVTTQKTGEARQTLEYYQSRLAPVKKY